MATIITTKKAPRITKAQRFEDIKNLLNGLESATIKDENGNLTPRTTLEDALAFCDAELILLTNKNKSGETKAQKEKKEYNQSLKELVYGFLKTQDEGVTCTIILKSIPELAPFGVSKVTYLVKDLEAEGRVKKELVKGKSLISIT